jgi:hypothetical protein
MPGMPVEVTAWPNHAVEVTIFGFRSKKKAKDAEIVQNDPRTLTARRIELLTFCV